MSKKILSDLELASGVRIKGLSAPVDNAEPARKADLATAGIIRAVRMVEITAATSTTSTTWVDLLTSTFTTDALTTKLIIDASTCAQLSTSTGVLIQVMVDGVAIRASGSRASSSSTAGAPNQISTLVDVSGGASHTVKIRWRVAAAATATIDPTQNQDTSTGAISFAVLRIQEAA